MASPPFVISTSIPGDSDIVSQFPLVDRTVRDVIQSWILANHDTNGNHPTIKMPYQGSTPAAPSASINTIYADSVGCLKFVKPDGTLHFVGVPPATVAHTAATAIPAGWLVADGSAVSRTTYADLFTALGTAYGAGNGSTTFNVPDLNGRVVAGEDNSAGRLTAAGGMNGVGYGAVGGLQTTTILTVNLPAYTPTGTVAITQNAMITNDGGNHVPGSTVNPVSGAATITAAFTGNAQGGLSTPIYNVQPTIVLKAIIKT